MKVLVLGGSGMAGHMITQYFRKCSKHTVFSASRKVTNMGDIELDVRNQGNLEKVIDTLIPDVIINCVGLLNENASQNPLDALLVNSILPHTLTKLMNRHGGRLIHISTDCVFSGEKGNYEENDPTDGETVYAKTKSLGEIIDPKHLTIRTSIVGPEIRENGIGLLHWFMQQSGEIKGYTNVFWNGVTTLELAKVIDQMIEQNIFGLYHLSAPQKISKYELLKFFKEVFDKQDVMIIPYETVMSDKTLKNTRKDFQYQVPGYKQMLVELRDWLDQQ
ncbi:SDR family oxidoreductase [Neobacillus sp. MER 74]|uniref:dTDP-4-dehydrorhamnose reductase family protein n=1 Tax=Neobacillus sp. MER 74 TaxID=2939566 RepID=UPI0020420921|nr:SDR family oxidoreductase [Neobacillus sp. MER 74]MCM3117096.1 SDR family oxidoreductase [Neobacillus sp. MER 74]